MAILNSGASSVAPIVLGGPAGVPGPKGADSTVPGPPGRDGAAAAKGDKGDPQDAAGVSALLPAATVTPTGATGPQPVPNALSATRTGTSTRARPTNDKILDLPDARDWNGLDLTGNNAATTIVQAILNDTSINGYRTHVPEGILTLDSPVMGNTGARFSGVAPRRMNAINNSLGTITKRQGTWIHKAHAGIGFSFADAGGSPVFEHFGVYEDQPPVISGQAWTPANNDFAFDVTCSDAVFRDIVLHNVSRGIRSKVGRTVYDGVRGQPLIVGIDQASSYDVVDVSKLHFWLYSNQSPEVQAYMAANAVGMRWGRNGNPQLGHIFFYGYRKGFEFYTFTASDGSPGGVTTGMQGSNLDFDACAQSLFVAPGTSGVTANFGNLIGAQDPSTMFEVPIVHAAGSNTRITIENPQLFYAFASAVRAEAGNNIIRLGPGLSVEGNTGAGLAGWDRVNKGYAALDAAAGSVIYRPDSAVFLNPGGSGGSFTCNGNVKGTLDRGVYSGTTATSNGQITIPHNAGCIPSYEFLKVADGGDGLSVRAVTRAAASITAVVTNGGGTPVGNLPVRIAYELFAA